MISPGSLGLAAGRKKWNRRLRYWLPSRRISLRTYLAAAKNDRFPFGTPAANSTLDRPFAQEAANSDISQVGLAAAQGGFLSYAILWVNMIAFTVASASIVLAAVLYARRRFIWLKWYLLYQISYAALLFALTFHYVSMTYLAGPGLLIAQLVAGLRLAASAVVLYAYPCLIGEISRGRIIFNRRPAVRRIAILAVMVGIVAPNVYFVYFDPHVVVMRLFNVVMNAYLLGLTLYGIVAFSLRDRMKRMLRPFLWLSCGFYLYAVIAGSLLTSLGITIDYLNALSASLYCLPWSIVLSILLFRHFSVSAAPPGLPPDFLKEHGISSREQEMLRQLIQGKTNRQIADSSFISLRTVETHLYNVYRKCGVENRVELIRKIQGYRY